MKRILLFSLLLSLFLVAACSSNSQNDRASNKEMSQSDSGEMAVDYDSEESEELAAADEIAEATPANRMMIYMAQLHLNVKNLENAMLNIEKKVSEYGGYIVESNVYREDEESVSGKITVRVPENHFRKLLREAEGEAADIVKRNETGRDVTEQYVDLESRVKAKRVVEERLLEFMSKAEKTEDLLKISSDLGKTQEEIEMIVGKMKFLENQTSYSTIEITMYENRVIIPELDSKNFDTWEKTKKQLATSTNFILAAASGLVVFLIGNIPVIALLLLVVIVTYMSIKRKKI